jgi:hypothetical protein
MADRLPEEGRHYLLLLPAVLLTSPLPLPQSLAAEQGAMLLIHCRMDALLSPLRYQAHLCYL